jgi:hypothetical protein
MRQAAIATALLLTAGACDFPEKRLTPVDAQGPAFACLGQPVSNTADAKVPISGSLEDPFTGDMLANVVVEGFLANQPQMSFFTTTSAADGKFTHDQGTGGAPLDIFLRTTPNGYAAAYFYPAVAIAHKYDRASIQMFAPAEVAMIAGLAGATVDPAKVVYFVTVIDCNGNFVPGATVASNPPGDIRYFANRRPSGDAVATDAMTGSAMILNVPPGNATISATVNGMVLRSHSLGGVAGALMETEIQP